MRISLLDRFIGGALLLVLIGAVILVGGVTPADDDASAFNAQEQGRRGAFRLLQELGFDAVIWEGAPGALPGAQSGARPGDEPLLWLPETPLFAGTGRGDEDETNSGPERASVLGHLHQAARYAEYLAAGGGLVLADGVEARRFLKKDLGVDLPWPGSRGDRKKGAGGRVGEGAGEEDPAPSTDSEDPQEADDEPGPLLGDTVQAFLPDGEALEVVAQACPPFEGRGDRGPRRGWSVWLEREDGAPLILDREHADAASATAAPGHIYLLAGDAWLANDVIGTADHGLLAVRLAEAFHGAGGTGTILFDEYALGGWRPDTKRELAFAPEARALSFLILLFALLSVWRLAWPREFPRDPAALDTISPLARARAQASLLERAGAQETLSRLLIAGRLERMAESSDRRARRSAGGGGGHAEAVGELIRRAGLPEDEGGEWVRRIDGHRTVTGEGALEDLDACLDDLEERLAGDGGLR